MVPKVHSSRWRLHSIQEQPQWSHRSRCSQSGNINESNKIIINVCWMVPKMYSPRGVLVFLKFGQCSSELTKTWSSGATEYGVWIGNCNVKVWKSTEHKLHKIWHSLKFCVNSGKRAHPRWRLHSIREQPQWSHGSACNQSTPHSIKQW